MMLAERNLNVVKKVTFQTPTKAVAPATTIESAGTAKENNKIVNKNETASASPIPGIQYDAFGFVSNPPHVLNGCTESEESTLKWDKYIENHGLDWVGARSKELEQLVMTCNIPKKHRPTIWMKWSGAEEMKEEKGDSYYSSLQKQSPEEKVMKQIELDIPRTCPQHKHFLHETSAGREQLRHVLYAYAVHNKDLGYLQSMNFIAAQLLLVTENEEQTFWILTAIVERMLGEGFYTGRLGKLLKSIDTFSALVAEKLPQVSQKLDKVGLNISFRVPNWFLCMYFNSLKSEITTRAWDMVFFHASDTTEALACIGLALVDIARDGILGAKHAPGCARSLQTMADQVIDGNDFLRNAFAEKWSVNQIRRAMRSQTIQKAVQEVRSKVVAPRTAYKHKRSRSAGDADIFSSINKNGNVFGKKGAQTAMKSKRRRLNRPMGQSCDDASINKRIHFGTPSKARNTNNTDVGFSPFVALKKWFTPSKRPAAQSSKKSSRRSAVKSNTPLPGITFHAHNLQKINDCCGSPMGMEMQPTKAGSQPSSLLRGGGTEKL